MALRKCQAPLVGQLPIIINNEFKLKLLSVNLRVLILKKKQVSIITLPGINSSASGVCVVEASSSTQSVASNDHQQRADENQASASDHLQLNTKKEVTARNAQTKNQTSVKPNSKLSLRRKSRR